MDYEGCKGKYRIKQFTRSIHTGGYICSSASFGDGAVYFGSYGGSIFALR
ncbi:MAG: PQQ-binding-like beta-propeller repeat protein [Chloroflexi bacterium]|nr:PQQ-binding-like beta-propeller repeat protein [Chloroflexota bacterium]